MQDFPTILGVIIVFFMLQAFSSNELRRGSNSVLAVEQLAPDSSTSMGGAVVK